MQPGIQERRGDWANLASARRNLAQNASLMNGFLEVDPWPIRYDRIFGRLSLVSCSAESTRGEASRGHDFIKTRTIN